MDKSTKQSVLLIKVYSQYLLDQDVLLLPEEDIFEDYVLLNLNLNNLKSLKEEDTYIYRLDKEIEKLNSQAQNLGFEKGYITQTNVPDLLSYYSKIYTSDLDSSLIYLPLIEESSIYVFDNLSQIDDVSKINVNLKNIDAYNYYVVINKFVGKNNSVITDFKEITNRINYNLDVINNKIKNYEKEIENNYAYLESTAHYETLKKNYFNKEITFGYYLSELKKIMFEINRNKINLDKLDVEKENSLLECDLVILNAKEFSNLFIKEKIKAYEKSNNFLEKKDICEVIKKIINEKNCVDKITRFLLSDEESKSDFDLLKIEEGKECIEILGNINYKLEGSEKIIFFKKYLEEIKEKLKEVLREDLQQDLQIEIQEINIKTQELIKKDNVDIIIDYSLNLAKVQEINNNLEKIIRKIIDSEKNIAIKVIFDKTFLIVTNPFSFNVLEVELKNNFGIIISKNNQLKATPSSFKIANLLPGENLFEIVFENKKEIDFEIIYLDLEKSIVKIIIKNQVEGIFDNIDFLSGFVTSNLASEIKGSKLYFETKKENEIFAHGPLFEITVERNILDIISEKGVIVEKITLKNRFFKEVLQKMTFMDFKKEDLILIKENGKEIDYKIENNKVVFEISVKKNEIKKYDVEIIRDVKEIYLEMQEMILEVSKFKNTKFLDVKKDADNTLSTLYSISYKETYNFEEIKKAYSKDLDIKRIRRALELSEIAESNYFLTENKLLEKQLTTQEREKHMRIDSAKYNNIRNAEKEINLLLEQVVIRENKTSKEIFLKNQEELAEIKNKINFYGLDIPLEQIISRNTTEEIKLLFLDKLKNKADVLYVEINPKINALDSRQINTLVNKVYSLYQERTLPEMYSVKYFAGITENDAKRLEKNVEFLDSVLFNKEITNFEENYDNKEYEKAINSISTDTINRIYKIKKDAELIEKGLDIIKNDAKNEILEYQKKEFNQEILSLAKSNYEEEKYLDAIYLIKSQNTVPKKTIKTKQIIISLLILVVFSAIYAYFRLGKTKKEESIKDKKKKIIRK